MHGAVFRIATAGDKGANPIAEREVGHGVFPQRRRRIGLPVREASRAEQHCTAEVAAALLQQAGDLPAAEGLNQHFRYFRQQYLAGKPTRPEASVTAMQP
ncbi:hypothetical protein ABMB44_13090 [Levilactobacillus brevis]